MELKDIQTILEHFEGDWFPRTIFAPATNNKQIEVNSIEQAYAIFKQSDFIDCRINAYPAYTNYQGINRQSPNFVMCDLDMSKFRTEKLILKTLYETIENISKDLGRGSSTIMFTGRGYHIYRPIILPILESESLFTPFENPSTEFIRYAAQRWTNGKNDPSNHPSVNSCLLRVPNSINSKNGKVVEVVELWDKTRPVAKPMLYDFYIKLAAKKLASKSRQQQKGKKDYYYKNRYIAGKNYKHFGHIYGVGESAKNIDWIEHYLLNEHAGISDCRKITIDLVLSPYLVNIKRCDYGTAYDIIVQWLDKCGRVKPLDFKPRYRVNYALNKARNEGIPPMRLETMKAKYPDMYAEITR